MDHERIWLQNPQDISVQSEGRWWCEDKVWPDDDGDGEPTEYVRADLYTTLRTENEQLRREQDAIRNETRERCAKAVCSGCATGVHINDFGYHQHGTFTFPCHAEAIRNMEPRHD